jgi:hypothetical protein
MSTLLDILPFDTVDACLREIPNEVRRETLRGYIQRLRDEIAQHEKLIRRVHELEPVWVEEHWQPPGFEAPAMFGRFPAIRKTDLDQLVGAVRFITFRQNEDAKS